MGTETRIGIATGLLIVVVASVYFFYGSDRSEEDLFITTVADTDPPKVPSTGNRRDNAADKTNARTGAPANGPRASASGRQSGSRPDKRTVNRSTRSGNPQARADQTPPRPGALSANNGRPAKRTAPSQANRSPRGTQPGRSNTTTLRTGPSKALVEATKGNLRARQDAGSPDPAGGNRGATSPRTAIRPGSKPTSESTKPTRPAAKWPRRHTIEAGDTLSDISVLYYGSSRHVDHIRKANPKNKNPAKLKLGDVLVIPAPDKTVISTVATPRSDVARPGPTGGNVRDQASSSRTYRVKEGDTFYRIAQQRLGNASRWKEILKLNHALVKGDPARLKPGMVLKLPK